MKIFLHIIALFIVFLSLLTTSVRVFADTPQRPTNIRTQPGSITSTSLTIHWSEVTATPPVNRYQIRNCLNSTPSECNKPANQIEIGNNSITLSNLLPNTQYLVQLAACNSDGCSPFLSQRFITLREPTPIITLTPTLLPGGSTPLGIPSSPGTSSSNTPTDFLAGLKNIFDCGNPTNSGSCTSGSSFPRIAGATNFTTLSGFISGLLDIVFIIAFFLAFIWLVWGAFEYIFAGGSKEGLGKARARMIWAIVGLIILFLSFALAQFVEQVLKPQGGTPVSLITPAYAQTPIITAAPVDISKTYAFGNIPTLGEGINNLVMPAFSIAAIAVVIYFIAGAFTYLTSGGDKGGIEKAKGMITHSIIGFLLLMFIFLIMQFIPQFSGFDISLF